MRTSGITREGGVAPGHLGFVLMCTVWVWALHSGGHGSYYWKFTLLLLAVAERAIYFFSAPFAYGPFFVLSQVET